MTKLLVLAGLALAVAASSGAAASPRQAPMLGVVPHAGADLPSSGKPLTTSGTGPAAYHGGQVMRTNTAYAIYWIPAGFSVDASYESLVNRYFGDVAAASGSQSNVYSTATQYYDNSAAVHYQSTFGGSYLDTHRFPASGCTASPVCLTDQQIQDELQTVLTTKGWHGGTGNVFFVMTPNGVASCFDTADRQCSTNFFCAYHSNFFDSGGEPVIYANQPYAGTIAGCTHSAIGQQGFPNDHDSDATINAISHEHNEAITDPFGDAWWANDGREDEIADLCAGDFGSPLGTVNGQPYNQLINGHAYSLQEEYSNDNGDCVSSYTPTLAPGTVAPPVLSGAAGEGRVLSTSEGSWTHAPSGYAYRWQRCAANGSACADIAGATAATYQLTASDVQHVLRAEVSAHNAVGTAGFVPSAASAVVVPPPSETGTPSLSGVAAVGKKLSTTSGTWSTTVTLSYRWLRCAAGGAGCKTIRGATAASHRAAAADAGHRIEALVTATNAAGTAQALTRRSGVVVGVPRARRAPHVSGRVRVGRRLSARRGSWSGPPKRYRYQWLRCNTHGRSCVRIRHAVHSTYRVTPHDASHRLRVRVTAIDAAGRRAATSRPTANVPAAR